MANINSAPPPMGAPKTASKAAPKKTVKEQRQEALEGLGQMAQVPLLATKQWADAGALGLHWPKICSELTTLAESQEAIAKFIDPLIKVGPYTGLVGAILPFAMQIAVNHGRVAAGAMGTVPANALAAQIEASLAQAEMEALNAQLQAEKAAQALRDQIKLARQQMMDSQASQATTVEHVN